MAKFAKSIGGLWRAARQYWNNPKGRHDILDYLKASVVFWCIVLLIFFALHYFNAR